MNVFSLFENAALAWRDRPAVRFGKRRQTYGELLADAAAFASHLAALGLQRGDRVALYMRNGFGYPAALLGAFRGGYVAVPINVKLRPREAAFIVENAETRAVLVDADNAESLSTALTGARPSIILTDQQFDAGGDKLPAAACEPDDPAWLFYTSGTTGRPKGAMLSHRNLIAMALNCLADVCDFRLTDRLLHAAPLSHGSGLYLIPALARGAENVIDDGIGFEPDRVLQLIRDQGITVLPFLAPTMIVRLLDADPAIEAPALRAIVYGGAPIHLEHIRSALKRFGPVLTQLYGQGEAPMTISYLPAWAHAQADDETLRSAGFTRTGVEVRLLDEEGSETPLGETGEICVRGDVVMRGYWRNAAANAAAFSEGWLRTGDIGRFDAGGRLHILDRRHDTIITGGSNVYPREVEDVLTRHPSVKEAIVFGVPDLEWGESVFAAVAPRGGCDDLSPEALIAFCREHLGSFKKPKHIEILTDLPKNAYGKVLRRELRDRFAAKR